MQHRVPEYYQVCSNNDPGLTLMYYTAKSNLVPYAFVWEKGKKVYSLETAKRIGAKFCLYPPWDEGTKVCSIRPGHMTSMAAMPIYGENPLKSFSLEPKGR